MEMAFADLRVPAVCRQQLVPSEYGGLLNHSDCSAPMWQRITVCAL
jgi:hypothetical protein